MEVDRALVDGRVGGGLVDRAQEAARAVLDDLDRVSAPAADVGEVGGPFAARPVPGLRPAAEQLRGLQLWEQVRRRRAEEVQVPFGQGEFRRCRAQVRGQDVRVVGVQDRGLHRLVEEGFRVVDEERVQGVVAGHQDGQRSPAGASGAARLLPEGGAGAGVAGDQDRVQPGDVDAEFEGGGGG